MARANYYLDDAPAPEIPAETPAAPEETPDLLIGRDAMAAALGISRKQFDRMHYGDQRPGRRRGAPAPTRKVPGMGLVAERAALTAWFRARVLPPS